MLHAPQSCKRDQYRIVSEGVARGRLLIWPPFVSLVLCRLDTLAAQSAQLTFLSGDKACRVRRLGYADLMILLKRHLTGSTGLSNLLAFPRGSLPRYQSHRPGVRWCCLGPQGPLTMPGTATLTSLCSTTSPLWVVMHHRRAIADIATDWIRPQRERLPGNHLVPKTQQTNRSIGWFSMGTSITVD